ncbi:MAG: hypothetical protein R6V01_03410 [Thermoplasmatota archaeon]
MEPEKVEVAEVLEEPVEERPRRRITAGPIIAIVIVVILVAVALIYAFTGSEVEEITILEPEVMTRRADERYGISVEVRVMGGVKAVEGTGSRDIIFQGKTEYSQQVEIRDDMGTARIEYDQFIIANGNYTIVFSMDGRSEEIHYLAKMVPHELNLTIQSGNPFEKDSDAIMLVASPEFDYPDGQGESIYYYSPNYEVKTVITGPDGAPEETTRTMEEWNGQNRTLTKVWKEVELDEMGDYTFSAEFTNLLVKPGSPYRTLTSDPEYLTSFINRAPEITDIDGPERVRPDNDATFTIKAVDPDSNGRITYYSIDWGEEGGDLQFLEIEEGESSTIRVSHSWSERGTYTISVTCADNGPENEQNPEEDFRRYDTQTIDILVSYL